MEMNEELKGKLLESQYRKRVVKVGDTWKEVKREKVVSIDKNITSKIIRRK